MSAHLTTDEPWLCKARHAREILGNCTRAEMEEYAGFLPRLQIRTATLYIVEYLEALIIFTGSGKLHVQDSRFKGSLPAFARTPLARSLISDAHHLSDTLLRGSLVVEEMSAYFNLPQAEIYAWRQHQGLVTQKAGEWVVRGERLRPHCKWLMPKSD